MRSPPHFDLRTTQNPVLHGNTLSAVLVVWACIVSCETMHHPVLLERDSKMHFEKRAYTTLPRQSLVRS